MSLTIKERSTGSIIATGAENENVRVFEGAWYFNPELVDMQYLHVTQRTYTCPYKGVCYWIDIETPKGKVQNVAWVYRDPKKGYERIQNRIAFYQGNRQGTISEKA